MDDSDRLRQALAPIEVEARGLRWAETRPWKTETHVFFEGELPVVDLHDLDSRNARAASRLICALATELEAGAVKLITGRGRHSIGPGGVLGGVVRKELKKACKGTTWRFRAAGGGWILIVNPAKAPAAATGALGWGFWLMAALFGLAVVVALANQLGLVGH